jgi:hypothetical protein
MGEKAANLIFHNICAQLFTSLWIYFGFFFPFSFAFQLIFFFFSLFSIKHSFYIPWNNLFSFSDNFHIVSSGIYLFIFYSTALNIVHERIFLSHFLNTFQIFSLKKFIHIFYKSSEPDRTIVPELFDLTNDGRLNRNAEAGTRLETAMGCWCWFGSTKGSTTGVRLQTGHIGWGNWSQLELKSCVCVSKFPDFLFAFQLFSRKTN